MSTPKTVGESSKSGASIVQGRASARSNNRRCDWSAILGQDGGQSFAPEKFVVVGCCRILTEVLGFLTFQAEMELCFFFFFFFSKGKKQLCTSESRKTKFVHSHWRDQDQHRRQHWSLDQWWRSSQGPEWRRLHSCGRDQDEHRRQFSAAALST